MKSKLITIILVLVGTASIAQQPQLMLRAPQGKADFLMEDSSGQEAITLTGNTLFRWNIRTGACMQQRQLGESVSKIRIGPSKRWLALATERKGTRFLSVRSARNFEELARLDLDSAVAKGQAYRWLNVGDISINEERGWVGAVGGYGALFFQYEHHTAVVKKLSRQCNTICCFGEKWLLALSPEKDGVELALSETDASSPLAMLGNVPTSEFPEMLIPSADKTYALLLFASKAFLILPDKKPAPCANPQVPNLYVEAKNYWWGSDRRELFFTTNRGSFEFHSASNSITQIETSGGGTYRYGSKFAMPLLAGAVFLRPDGVSARDCFLFGPDTTCSLSNVVPFGNDRLSAPWDMTPAGPSSYMLHDGTGYYEVNLNNLEAQTLDRPSVQGWLTQKQLPLPGGAYAEIVAAGNGKFGTEYSQQLGVLEYTSSGDLDTAYDIGATGITTFSYLSGSGKYIYAFDVDGRQFYKVNRKTLKSDRSPLPLPPGIHMIRDKSFYAALAGDDFLIASKSLWRYSAATGTFTVIDSTDDYEGLRILTTVEQGGSVFYIGRKKLDDNDYRPVLKRYELKTGVVWIADSSNRDIKFVARGRCQGSPCWFVAVRDGGWFVQAYNEDFGKRIGRVPVSEAAAINALLFDSTKNLLLVLQGYAVHVFDAARNAPAADLYFSHPNSSTLPVQALAITPGNHYYIPSREAESLNWMLDGRSYEFTAFDRYFNNPAYVLRALRSPDSVLIKTLTRASELRQKRAGPPAPISGLALLPSARFVSKEIPFAYAINDVQLPVLLKAGNKKIMRLRVSVGNVPEPQDKDLSALDLKPGKETRLVLPLHLEQNTRSIIKIQAFDEEGRASIPDEIPVFCRMNESSNAHRTWYLGIGISRYSDTRYNLRFAAKDASDVEGALEKSAGIILKNSTLLTDSLVTGVAIDEALKMIASKVHTNDILIVSFSGHGVSRNGKFYLTTYSTDFQNMEKTAYPFEQLSKGLRAIGCRKKLLLIDACASGDADETGEIISLKPTPTLVVKEGKGIDPALPSGPGAVSYLNLMKEYFADMGDESGATVIAATSGTSVAFEDEHFQNGAFTYAFLKGYFDMQADANSDNIISVSELAAYLSKTVRRITGGRQLPSIRSIDLRNDWKLDRPDE